MATDDERIPLSERRVSDLVRDATILLDIPALIEDLNEAGQEVELVISGYEWTIKHTGGSMICHSWRCVVDMLTDMRAKLTAEHGEPGRPE